MTTVPQSDPSFSLTFALRCVASAGRCNLDADDLHAALGLPLMVCAPRNEPDARIWPAYARDVFLIEAARAFGMTLRGIHPPQAARGLERVREFEQHFDASYRPLIARALENGQPVLAWQGWGGDFDYFWGIIERGCDNGVGFTGTVFAPSTSPYAPLLTKKGSGEVDAKDLRAPFVSKEALGEVDAKDISAPLLHKEGLGEVGTVNDLVLTRPPLQVYIVETASPAAPPLRELLDLALRHAYLVLNGEPGERFDVIMGPPAFDVWIDLATGGRTSSTINESGKSVTRQSTSGLESPTAKERKSSDESPSSHAALPSSIAAGHAALASSIIAGHESFLRFLHRHCDAATAAEQSFLTDLRSESETVVSALSRAIASAAEDAASPASRHQATFASRLQTARTASARMRNLNESKLVKSK